MVRNFLLFSLVCLVITSCSPGMLNTQLPQENFPEILPTTATILSPQQTRISIPTELFPTQQGSVGKMLPANIVIVYEKAGNIWLNKTNMIAQVTNGGADSRPKLSPLGDSFVFVRNGCLWIWTEIDNQPMVLFSKTGFAPGQFSFDKTGKYLFLSTISLDGVPQYDLFRVNLDSGSIEQLLQTGSGGYFVENPSNSNLVLSRPGKLLLYDFINNQITDLFTFTPKNKNEIAPLTWINSGYGFYTVLPTLRPNGQRYMFFPAKGEIPAQIAEFSATSATMNNAIISPNGMYVVYIKTNNTQKEVHIIDASTTDKIISTSESSDIELLGWSDESDRFIFSINGAPSQWDSMDGSLLSISHRENVSRIQWLNKEVLLLVDGTKLIAIINGQEYLTIDSDIQGEFHAVVLSKK